MRMFLANEGICSPGSATRHLERELVGVSVEGRGRHEIRLGDPVRPRPRWICNEIERSGRIMLWVVLRLMVDPPAE